jgi:hypothetical protein
VYPDVIVREFDFRVLVETGASLRRPQRGRYHARLVWPDPRHSIPAYRHAHVTGTRTPASNLSTARLTFAAGIRRTLANNRSRRASPLFTVDRSPFTGATNPGSIAMADRAASSPVCV